MIKVSWATFFLVYLSGYLACLFFLWLKSHFYNQKKSHSLPQHAIKVCEFCQTVYRIPKIDKLTRCPLCKSLNP